MNNQKVIEKLNKMGACSDAVMWAKEHGGTSAELWRDCERGDWMGWYLGKSPKLRKSKAFFYSLAEIIEVQAVPIYAKFDKKEMALKNVVKTLRDYADGKATKKDLKTAAYAAAYAANAATNAAYAAYAAARTVALKQSADIFRKWFAL